MLRPGETLFKYYTRHLADVSTEELEGYVRTKDRRTAIYKAAASLFMDREDADLRMMSDWERTPHYTMGRKPSAERIRRSTFQWLRKQDSDQLMEVIREYPPRSVVTRTAAMLLALRAESGPF